MILLSLAVRRLFSPQRTARAGNRGELTNLPGGMHHEGMTNDKSRDEPVTYGDFEDFSVALATDLKKWRRELQSDMRQLKDEIIREFKVTAENIHADVAGANKDETSSLKDADTKLHERVKVVEERLGIPTPPAT
jgi:hypothetical protein